MPSKKGRRPRRPSDRSPEREASAAEPASAVAVGGAGEDATAPIATSVLPKADAISAAVVGAVAALVFLSTFSTHVALGDAPEAVAGVRALGILHAPGYPSYVLAAHAFGDVVPLGSWAFRVNLFSLVCATLTIAAAYLLARGFGAGRAGAAIGALSLAVGVSFWFDADFAKHYAFSGLLGITAALLVVWWQASGRAFLLVVAGVLLGACTGASWEIAVIMALGLIVLLFLGPRRPRLGAMLAAVAGLIVVAIGVWVFVLVRARTEPAVNWGDATNLHRLLQLISQQDFRGAGVTPTNGGVLLGRMPTRAAAYVGIVARELGLGAFVIALVGIVVAFRTLRRDQKLFLLIVGVLNILAAALVTGVEHITGFLTGLIAGGYLLDVFFVIVVLVALGTDATVEAASLAIVRWRVADRFQARREAELPGTRVAVFCVVGALVLVPSVIVHYSLANHRMPPLSDRYGSRVLDALPPHAVLFVSRADWLDPILERQVVDGQRRDVTLINIDTTSLSWYREQLTRQLSLGTTLDERNDETRIVKLVTKLRATRPVYLDTSTMQELRGLVGYRADGFVGEVVDGKGPHSATDLGKIAATLQRADRDDGLGHVANIRFPNFDVYFFHERAHIELAKEYMLASDVKGAELELQRAGDVYPSDTQVRLLLRYIEQHPDQARSLILNL